MDHMERDCTPGPAAGGLSRPALTSRTRGHGLAQGKAIDNARRGQTRVASSSRSDGKKRRATQTCKPGSVTRGAAPQSGGTADGDHLSSPPKATWAIGHPRSAGRCYHRGRAANPGTGRAPIVPLFGLAPGGVWPSLCHHRRPDALTVRFHPYPSDAGRTVCFCATFRLPRRRGRRGSLGVTQHPAQRSPDFPPRRPNWLGRRGGHPVYLALHKNSSIAS